MPNSHAITLTEAVTMTHDYQNDSTFTGMTVSGKYDASVFEDLLAQNGAAGIRIYFAKNSAGTLTTVLVATDDSGNDLTDGLLMNKAILCPNNCPVDSPLMV
jgi:hypothetical protein